MQVKKILARTYRLCEWHQSIDISFIKSSVIYPANRNITKPLQKAAFRAHKSFSTPQRLAQGFKG